MNLHRRPKPQISLLVPFRASPFSPRARNWRWLKEYWAHELPDAELIMANSHGDVFSKTEAINRAAKLARGNIFVILDSDCYIPGSVIQDAADAIENAIERGHRRWYIPYRWLYRLTESTSIRIRLSDPADPWRPPHPPEPYMVESTMGSMHGRRYGAMIQILPREAFEQVGGMDPRFRGWGGEDVAFARAVDTLYNNHKTTKNDVLHLWHPKIGENYHNRMWTNQISQETNMNLSSRYGAATNDYNRMRNLVNEGILFGYQNTKMIFVVVDYLKARIRKFR